MDSSQNNREMSIFKSLPKETLVTVIGQLYSKISGLKKQLAEVEQRNRLLQYKLPRLINVSIKQAMTGKQCSCSPLASPHKLIPPESISYLDQESIVSPTISPNSNLESLSAPNNFSIKKENDCVAANGSALPSCTVLDMWNSLKLCNENDQSCEAVCRKSKLVNQKTQPSDKDATSDMEDEAECILGEEEDVVDVTKLPNANSSFQSFVLKPIPLSVPTLGWPSTSVSNTDCPTSSIPLSALKTEDDDQLLDLDSNSSDNASCSITQRSEEIVEVSEEALREVDAHINASHKIKKNRYWQLYQDSIGWTRATCALMSCLFTRHQMANSTVFGRQTSSGETRNRLPVKFVHYIVTTISRRFNVLPSKVRARMAQKCKDARRVARKSRADNLSDLPKFVNLHQKPLTSTSLI